MLTLRRFIYTFLAFSLFTSAYAQDGVQIIKDNDTIAVCLGTSIQLEAIQAESFSWRPVDIIDSPDSNIVVVTPLVSGYVYVDGTSGLEITTDSIYLEVVNVDVEIIASDNEFPVCEGEDIQLQSATSHSGGTYFWSTENLILDENVDQITLAAPRGGMVFLTYEVDGCTATDTVSLDVIDFAVPELTTTDTLVCQGQVFPLASDPGVSTTIYTWSPNQFLSDNSIANPVFTATESTLYTLTVESEDGSCSETFSINIDVTPITLNLNIQDTVMMCLGDSLNIIASVNGSASGFSWAPNDGAFSSQTDLNIIAKPDYTNFYYARYELNGCVLIDTFLLVVDSIPDNREINVIPLKDEYCPGEEISLFSGMYEGILYPDIRHQWRPADASIQSAIDGYNLFIETTVTNLYIRTTTNGGCMVEDSVEIIVIEPSVELNLTDTIVCPGQPVQLMVLNDVEDISWSPEAGLSCSDCPDPIATVFQTTEYTVSGEDQGCPASASVTINIYPLPILIFELIDPEGDIYIGDAIEIMISGLPELPDDAIISWQYNGQSQSETGTTLSGIFADNLINTITATYITANGCPVTISGNLPAMEPEYDIPNAFTPDGDDTNDIFRAVLKGAVEVEEILVFNRWGQKVFEGSDNTGWDGTFRGQECPPEVYAYRIVLRLPNGRTFQERGDLTLLR